MEVETKILLTALRNFLDRDEVKNKMITAVMPNDPRLGDLAGKEVEMPLTTVFQGLTHKVAFKDMAKTLDDNNDVVRIFMEELYNELQVYVPPVESSDVSIKSKEKEVDTVAKELKDISDESKLAKDLKGDSDESEQVE